MKVKILIDPTEALLADLLSGDWHIEAAFSRPNFKYPNSQPEMVVIVSWGSHIGDV